MGVVTLERYLLQFVTDAFQNCTVCNQRFSALTIQPRGSNLCFLSGSFSLSVLRSECKRVCRLVRGSRLPYC